MTRVQQTDMLKYGIPITILVMSVAAYVWSSATRFQKIDSQSLENKSRLERVEHRVEKQLTRVEGKVDALLRKTN